MRRDKETVSALGYALLALLHQRPRSGYDLRKTFAESPLSHYSSSPGSIYPALRRLEEKELIVGKTDRAHVLRPRQVFRVTGKGFDALKQWLRRPITREDIVWRVEELLLRFAFMGGVVDRADTAQFLNSFIDEIEAYIPELGAFYDAETSDMPIQGRLALESGIERYKGLARWARRALDHFG